MYDIHDLAQQPAYQKLPMSKNKINDLIPTRGNHPHCHVGHLSSKVHERTAEKLRQSSCVFLCGAQFLKFQKRFLQRGNCCNQFWKFHLHPPSLFNFPKYLHNIFSLFPNAFTPKIHIKSEINILKTHLQHKTY